MPLIRLSLEDREEEKEGDDEERKEQTVEVGGDMIAIWEWNKSSLIVTDLALNPALVLRHSGEHAGYIW